MLLNPTKLFTMFSIIFLNAIVVHGKVVEFDFPSENGEEVSYADFVYWFANQAENTTASSTTLSSTTRNITDDIVILGRGTKSKFKPNSRLKNFFAQNSSRFFRHSDLIEILGIFFSDFVPCTRDSSLLREGL